MDFEIERHDSDRTVLYIFKTKIERRKVKKFQLIYKVLGKETDNIIKVIQRGSGRTIISWTKMLRD